MWTRRGTLIYLPWIIWSAHRPLVDRMKTWAHCMYPSSLSQGLWWLAFFARHRHRSSYRVRLHSYCYDKHFASFLADPQNLPIHVWWVQQRCQRSHQNCGLQKDHDAYSYSPKWRHFYVSLTTKAPGIKCHHTLGRSLYWSFEWRIFFLHGWTDNGRRQPFATSRLWAGHWPWPSFCYSSLNWTAQQWRPCHQSGTSKCTAASSYSEEKVKRVLMTAIDI